ncbi:hypothetical protein LCGC14_1745110 [marine sediment metagenome]|uniref:Uncharacterized protein n=1 Tax=marine sediment metagenome TaxID=412755 RepID=A0A0F9H5K9_9ZZZZ
MVKKGIFVILAVLLILPFVTAQNIGVNIGEPLSLRAGVSTGVVIGDVLITNVNSSEFWDNRDTPADILLNELRDVLASSPTINQVLTFNLTDWIAKDIGTLAGSNGTVNNTNICYTNSTNTFTKSQIIVGNLNVTGNITGNKFHAFIHKHNASGQVISIPTDNVWFNMSFSGGDPFFFNGFHINSDNMTLVAEVGGLYMLSYHISFAGSGSGVYEFGILDAANIRIRGTGSTRSTTVGGGFGVVSTTTVMNISVNQEVHLGVLDSESPARDITITHMKMAMIRIGDIEMDEA